MLRRGAGRSRDVLETGGAGNIDPCRIKRIHNEHEYGPTIAVVPGINGPPTILSRAFIAVTSGGGAPLSSAALRSETKIAARGRPAAPQRSDLLPSHPPILAKSAGMTTLWPLAS